MQNWTSVSKSKKPVQVHFDKFFLFRKMKCGSTACSLIGFAGVALGLNLIVMIPRLFAGKPPSAYARDNADNADSELSKRARNAHANTVENLVVFIALALAAHVSNQTHITDKWFRWALLARVLQSAIHTFLPQDDKVVPFRALAFLPQVLIQGKVTWDLLRSAKSVV